MAAIAITLGVIFFIIGLVAVKIPLVKALIFSIGIIVANVRFPFLKLQPKSRLIY